MWTALFWRRAAERAIRSAAAAAIALITAAAFVADTVASWREVGIAAAVAAVVSVLTSLAGSQVGDPESPSLLREDTYP